MSAQVPSATFPVPPPVMSLQIIDTQTGRFTEVGIDLFTRLWAGAFGQGGVKDDTETLFGMHGDATIADDGTLTISDDAITTQKIADLAVTTAKLDDAAVTVDKLGDDAVETAKIKDKAVIYAKIQDVTDARLLGRSAGSAGPPMEITLGGGLILSGGSLVFRTVPVAVGALPAGSPGDRAMVNDANATTFASIVAAGGANVVPVYKDGSGNWRIG